MKRKDAFSLTEILILIFAIVFIALIVLPMKVIDINQAERIATWKSIYSELDYSYKVMLQKDANLVNLYKNRGNFSGELFFDNFLKYCNVDKKKMLAANFKNYKHSFLNGKSIKKVSNYHADKFVLLKNGTLLAFSGNTSADTKNDEPIGILYADINGVNSKNIIGKDVFIMVMYPDRLEPMGANSSLQDLKEDCSPVGSGLKCSAYYLTGRRILD
ncbi:MAG: hypothetical protein K6C94_00885 [Candidatus Gastranaerophilales bacterium]|nr:hypothetical protein [Candidatus Gastranaerophilales bacterium]